MERFFDTVDDPGTSDVALTATAFANRLNKASLAIRNVMNTPDIIGVEEMEHLSTLQRRGRQSERRRGCRRSAQPQLPGFPC